MNTQFIRNVSIDWSKIAPESYLRSIPALRGVEQLELRRPVTCFVGENGSGKSTLLEAIAVAYGFNPEGGTRNYHFSTYDSHSELCGAIRLSRGVRKPVYGYFLRAESFYNVATMENEYSRGPGGVPQHYHEKSHGESFLALAQNSLRAGGLYLLDEPEAALHSPILLGLPGAEILSFDESGIHPCAYEDTDSYQVMDVFLNHREQILQHLLDP